MEPEIVQRFLESVGSKADVDLYLKLFRVQRESFAIIAADEVIVRTALDPFHFDLRILAGMDLHPVVLLGLFDAKDADRQAQRVHEWLVEDGVRCRILAAGRANIASLHDEVRATIAADTIPVVSLAPAKDASTDARFNLLSTLARGLVTRKVIFLSTSAGLEREKAPHISVVNLAADYEALLSSRGPLSRRHAVLLRQVKDLVDEVPQRMGVVVVNPLQLLRELFTVSGAGTLIKKGSRIERHDSLATLDTGRLRGLIESAFGRSLSADALDRGIERVYVEEQYLGAAVLSPSPVGPYLTKFAVDRQAQGEGIGGDLWGAIARDYPSFFWRARPTNPITPWYAKQADGLARFESWHVFWRGLTVDRIQAAISFALEAPVDLTTDAAQPPSLV